MNLITKKDAEWERCIKQASDPFPFDNPPFDPIEFARELAKFMIDSNALSVAAPQIGVPYRIFAMKAQPQNLVVFNPRIVMPSQEEIRLEETSATFPGLIVLVKRPQHVRVRFQYPNGEIKTETYTGLTSRLFQHNIDVIDGVQFYTRAHRVHRDRAFRRWNKFIRNDKTK